MNTFISFVLVLFCVQAVYSECTVDLKDLPKSQPIYIKDGGFWAPNKESGKLVLQAGQSVQAGCPGKTNAVLLGKTKVGNLDNNTVDIKCVKGKTFSVSGKQGPLASVKCKSNPTIESVETNVTCFGGNKIYSIGFSVSGVFYKLYELCFDVAGVTTVYSHHNINPSCSFREASGRPNFIENGMFETTAIASLYKSKNQKERFEKILGEGMGDKYIKTNQSIRDHVKEYGKEIEVYTGTYGVERLPDKDGELTELYLDSDRNNNNLVPVPLYFYKVIYDPLHKKAAAFVQINSSFLQNSTAENLTFCNDICQTDSKMAWVKWRENDGTTSFCCDFKEFSKIVKHFDLDVDSLFY